MLDQLRGRNTFWNCLVEIERRQRIEVRSLLQPPESKVPALQQELEEARVAIKAERKRQRSRNADVSDLRAYIKDLQQQLKSARAEDKAARERIKEASQPRLDELEAERLEQVKAAQHNSNLYWCNYDDVLASYGVARVRAMREGTEIKFHRFDGTGKVSVRYQQGLPVADVFGADTRLQIRPVDPRAWTSPIRGERRRLARTVVRIRIGSHEDRSPVWLELPMVMHRPLPEGGGIRNAAVVRERIADSWRYRLVITVATPQQEIVTHQDRNRIAIDVGWRKLDEGLRVAYWVDDLGQQGQVLLANEVIEQFRKVDDLKSIRDLHFNATRVALVDWLQHVVVPDWLAERCKTLSFWQSQARLSALVRDWEGQRFDADDEMLAGLQAWWVKDRHLWQWESHLRDQVGRHRRELYRRFAADLVRRYRQVVLEDFDLRRVIEHPKAEVGTGGGIPGAWYRKTAAISSLRLTIEHTCSREGVEVLKVNPSYSTLTCHVCGQIDQFNAAAELVHKCSQCGLLWDQDANAAAVLLQRASQIEAVSEQKTSCEESTTPPTDGG